MGRSPGIGESIDRKEKGLAILMALKKWRLIFLCEILKVGFVLCFWERERRKAQSKDEGDEA